MDFSLPEFVLWALVVPMLFVAFFTLISRLSHRAGERRAVRVRIICRLCLHAFEDHGSASLPECPGCGALNERGRDRRLG
jgi:hypothetical protein